MYSGPEPPSGGVRRPPLAVIAPHCTQLEGVTTSSTRPSSPPRADLVDLRRAEIVQASRELARYASLDPQVVGLIVTAAIAAREDRRELVERELPVALGVRALAHEDRLLGVGMRRQPPGREIAVQRVHRAAQRAAHDQAVLDRHGPRDRHRHGRPDRPTFLDYPLDVVFMEGDAEIPPPPVRRATAGRRNRAGGGAARSGRAAGRSWPGRASTGGAPRSELRELAERQGIPVFLNGMGRGCLPADHPNRLQPHPRDGARRGRRRDRDRRPARLPARLRRQQSAPTRS